MSHGTCCWPSCATLSGDKYPALPMCDSHVAVVVHQVQITASPQLAIRSATHRSRGNGWIYYLRVEDRIKIGFSTNLAPRLKSYPPASVVLATHEGSMEDEHDLHVRFADDVAETREWFHPSPQVLDHIRSLATYEPLAIATWVSRNFRPPLRKQAAARPRR